MCFGKATCLTGKLTHLSRMDFPTLIDWTSPLLIYGMLGGIFYSNFNGTFCKETVGT